VDLLAGLDGPGPDSMDAAVGRLAAAVPAAGHRGRLLLSLGSPDEVDARRLKSISLAAGEILDGASGRPDLEIRCSDETLWAMLSGSFSPVEAFRDGKLRVRGDEQLGKKVLRHLAGPEGSVDCE
jgi:putative sterol carrier protein